MLFAALMVFLGLGFSAALTVDYGDSVYKTYELNDNEVLNVVITSVPAHVHGIYVYFDPSLEGHVYCAPGKVSHDANEVWDAQFSCILLKGSYEGVLYFKPADIDVDANGDYIDQPRTTRVSLTVAEKEVWYTSYAYSGLGGTITVGPYVIKVNDSDVVSADIEVLKGSVPVFSGVVFLGQEVKIADGFILTFNGYSEKRGMAFFTIKTKFPVAVSSSSAEYYLAVSPTYYAVDQNRARVDIYTNCPKVSVCDQNNECKSFNVPDTHRVSAIFSEGNYEVKCQGSDITSEFSVLKAPVVVKTVTKTVEKHEDPNDICPLWFFNLPDYRKASLCGSVPKSKPNSGGGISFDWRWIVLLLLIGAGAWWYFKRRGGSSEEEEEHDVEAVPDVEG